MEDAAKWIEFAVLFAAFIAAGWYVRRRLGGVTVAAVELKRRLEASEDLVVIDVRPPAEFTADLGHIDGAINIPLATLESQLAQITPDVAGYRDTSVVVVCRSGSSAHAAARMLRRAGLGNVAVLHGGMISWNARRLPVIRAIASAATQDV